MSTLISIVLDTSVIVAALFQSRSDEILCGWYNKEIQLSYSRSVLEEYNRILHKIPPIRQQATQFLEELRTRDFVSLVEQPPVLNIQIDDPDDRKFVECAVGANAEFLVSLDDHLLSLKSFQNVSMVSPKQFLAAWKSTKVESWNVEKLES